MGMGSSCSPLSSSSSLDSYISLAMSSSSTSSSLMAPPTTRSIRALALLRRADRSALFFRLGVSTLLMPFNLIGVATTAFWRKAEGVATWPFAFGGRPGRLFVGVGSTDSCVSLVVFSTSISAAFEIADRRAEATAPLLRFGEVASSGTSYGSASRERFCDERAVGSCPETLRRTIFVLLY